MLINLVTNDESLRRAIEKAIGELRHPNFSLASLTSAVASNQLDNFGGQWTVPHLLIIEGSLQGAKAQDIVHKALERSSKTKVVLIGTPDKEQSQSLPYRTITLPLKDAAIHQAILSELGFPVMDVLIVEGDDQVRVILVEVVKGLGHTPTGVETAQEAVFLSERNNYNLIITAVDGLTDITPENRSDYLRALAKVAGETPIIYHTGADHIPTQHRPNLILVKPVGLEVLEAAITTFSYHRRGRR